MIVKVALAVPPLYLLDYNITGDINLFDRVLVEVGKRKLIGFVVAKDITVNYDTKKIKTIHKKLDSPISKAIEKLILWLAQYYCCDLYSAICLALPNEYLKQQEIKPKQETFVCINNDKLSLYSPTMKQSELLEKFNNKDLIKFEELKSLGSSHIIKTLLDKNILVKKYTTKKYLNHTNKSEEPKKLNQEQQQALDSILENDGYSVSLLYGVTGSGKTEIYLQAIAQCLNKAKQALVLIPEINLTPQTVERFEKRFSDKNIVTLHSKLTDKTRLTNWINIKNNHADIVISTRSGVLSDFKNLGIIIVDEEHDSSFKQQTSTIRYNARDVAVFRAKNLNIPIILGSATPSIESYYNTIIGKYKFLKLSKKALNNYQTPIRIVDLKTVKVDNGISNVLFDLLERNINAHNQSLIFINKLGFAKALICKSCGSVVECKKCDKPYTLHISPYQHLACHFCGTHKPIVTSCDNCGSDDLIVYGLGTEKVQSRLEAKFPYNKIIRFDRANIKNIDDLNKVNQMISSNVVDIIVGTQMIAKGHHFDNITLVGLINIDSGLYSTDFHAIEKTAQMIIQVSGRAGRAGKAGLVILQTYQPENRFLQLLVQKDYIEFLDYLLEQRKYANYPPYTYQAQIIAESKKEESVLEVLNYFYNKISHREDFYISKPIPAIHLKKNNTYKYSLLVTSETRKKINSLIRWFKDNFNDNIPKSVRISFDIDPIELA